MKPVIVFLCVAVFCAHVESFPGSVDRPDEESNRDDVAEVYIVPMERRRAASFPFSDSDEFDSLGPVLPERDYGLTPFFNPFLQRNNNGLDDFLASMQAMLLRMRQEMDEMMHRLPPVVATDADTRFGVNDDGPLQNKSTSTTKVVDGHVVTVNETTFVNGDDKIGAVFRIKVVEVKPTEESGSDRIPAEESTETVEIPSENENVDNSNDETNEIPTEKVGSEVEDLNKA